MNRHTGAAAADDNDDESNDPTADPENARLIQMLAELQRRLDTFNRGMHARRKHRG